MPSETLTPPELDAPLEDAIERARAALLRRQSGDGHWVFELEADATIPAEYVLLEHYLDRIDPELESFMRRWREQHRYDPRKPMKGAA